MTSDGYREVDTDESVGAINADLSVGIDVTRAEPLSANRSLSNRGVQLFGSGFIVTPEEAARLGLGNASGLEAHIRPYLNGRDLTQSSRGVMVIDLFGLTADEVRVRFPDVFEHVLREVKPERDANRRAGRRDKWWLFGETNPLLLRRQLDGLSRYVATVETSKHRFFVFLDAAILPDNKLVAFALADAFHLGVLSSSVHVEWALAAGGHLGVGNDPVYVKSRCFDPFPFLAATPDQTARIRELGEAIDAHRKARQAADPTLTLTNLYNAVDALRAGREPDARDRAAAESGLAHTLLDLHRRLDRAVLEAYGWGDLDAESPAFRPAILERLVALNRERRDEELAGHVRWLRPEFQAPNDEPQTGLDLSMGMVREDPVPFRRPWPDTFAARLAAVRQLADSGRVTAADVQARFEGASRDAAQEVIDTLAERGLLRPG